MIASPQTAAPRAAPDDLAGVAGYVAAASARHERVLITLIPTLEEPRVVDPDLALGRLRLLVETLAGFAIGATVGSVARAARRSFGEEVRGRVALLLGRLLRAGAPAAPASELDPARFLRDPDRPLLDAFGARLLARIQRSIPQARACVAAIHAEGARAAPARLPAFADALERLTADDAPALAFFDQLAAGWRHYTATLTEHRPGRSREATREERAPALWRLWARQLEGPAAPAAPALDALREQGVLLRIA